MAKKRDPKVLSEFEVKVLNTFLQDGCTQTDAFLKHHKGARRWKSKTVHSRASELFAQGKVKGRIAAFREKIADKYEVTTERLIREMAICAYGDRTDLLNDDGSMKKFSEMDAEQRRMIEGVEISTHFDGNGDKVQRIEVKKIKTVSKIKALESLFKNKGLYAKDNEQKKPIYMMTTEEIMEESDRIRAKLNDNA